MDVHGRGARAGEIALARDQDLLDAAGVRALVCGRDGRIEAVTAGAESLLGPAARAATEQEFLHTLAEASHDPRTPEQLKTDAVAGGTVLTLHEDGGGLRIARRPLAGGQALWVFSREHAQRREEHGHEVLSIASHDLRSPLANVRSYAGMILGGRGPPLEPKVKRAAQVIAKNAERGLRLVDDLIDLRRAESGGIPLETASTSTSEPLRRAFEETRAGMDKDVQLVWAVPESLPVMEVDEERLRRMVRALLDAGIRRSPTGAEVRLTAEVRDEELYLAVEDTGERPSLRDAALAFDRDHQIVSARKLLPGISIALAEAIAKAHGGRVGFLPRAGRGAIHYAILPRRERR